MPLVLALLALLALGAPARADGTAVWLRGTPLPQVTPGLTARSAAEVAPDAAWTEGDDRAVAHLQAELAAVRPLKDELDGELQILRRLEAALAAVDLVRAEDRALVYDALALQGYAARRYFQDSLATDPAAAAWRIEVEGVAEVRPWVDAVALDPGRQPGADEVPDAPERIAFQELRARLLLQAPATVVVTGLPAGARVVADGVEAPADRIQLQPGAHLLAMRQGDRLVGRQRVRLASGQALTLPYLAGSAELDALAAVLETAPPAATLPAPVVARLAPLPGPVELLVPGRKAPLRYAVVDYRAVPAEDLAAAQEDLGPRGARTGLALHAGLGAGWIYDGDFLLQNSQDGAPSATGTVNAAAPFGTVGATALLGPAALGLGADLGLPLGDWHDLPVGEGRVRLRAYPHLAVGHRLVQVTAGPLLPWHLGLGGRLRLPLPALDRGPLELIAAGVYGLAIPMTAADGVSTFEADRVTMAWLGLGGRLQWPRRSG